MWRWWWCVCAGSSTQLSVHIHTYIYIPTHSKAILYIERPPSMKKKHKNPQREIQKKYSSRWCGSIQRAALKRTSVAQCCNLLVKCTHTHTYLPTYFYTCMHTSIHRARAEASEQRAPRKIMCASRRLRHFVRQRSTLAAAALISHTRWLVG
jgi:hypothetical protein